MCENCTRREFLGTAAMGSLMLTAAELRGAIVAGEASPPTFPSKVPIGVIFAGKPSPPDRSWGVCEQEIAAMQKHLDNVEKKLGNVEFVVGRASKVEDAAAIMRRAGEGAPVLAIQVGWGGVRRV